VFVPGTLLRSGSVLFLTLVFTAGLTFATVELPALADQFLQHHVTTPGMDSHADVISRLKTDLFMAHYHVRAIGYAAFALLVALITAGFATRRSGLAALGALGVMLPVFAQFAGVMFFLAGLGILNAVWLPVLDVSYDLQHWGRVIDAPNDLLRWLLRHVGIGSMWPTTLLFIGGGILIFLLGVYAWLTARARGRDVADAWVYRFSRHPQYLGWILWTYGAYLLVQRMDYPKRSWGIGASLPWLISTMVIIVVAMVEEMNMRRRHGDAYEAYHQRTPFLFPMPRVVERAISSPFRLLFGKARPDRIREVLAVVGLYTLALVGLSAFLHAGGVGGALARLASPEAQAARVRELAAGAAGEPNPRQQYRRLMRIAAFGEPAVDPLLKLLQGDDPGLRALAAQGLQAVRSPRAVPALCAAVADPDDNVRYWAAEALGAIGSPDAVPALRPLLDDPSAFVRLRALNHLAVLGDERIVARVPELLSDAAVWIRAGAVAALGTLDAEAGIPLLEARLADESPAVRREAVVALLRIGTPRVRPALQAARDDADWEVRIYATEALKRVPAS